MDSHEYLTRLGGQPLRGVWSVHGLECGIGVDTRLARDVQPVGPFVLRGSFANAEDRATALPLSGIVGRGAVAIDHPVPNMLGVTMVCIDAFRPHSDGSVELRLVPVPRAPNA